MNEKTTLNSPPLNNNLIAWSDTEIYSQSSNKDHCKRRVIFYQDGGRFWSHVEYLNDDNTRRCLTNWDYDTCITTAYYNFRKLLDNIKVDLTVGLTVNKEMLAKIEKGQASIDYANDQYSRNAS